MKRIVASLPLLLLTGLAACSVSPAQNYTIQVAPAADGARYVSVPPACPRWTDNDLNFFDNQPLPQFGCANAQNLAVMVERPEDLLEGRPSGPANGVTTAGSIVRYNNNLTRGLIYPSGAADTAIDTTTNSTANSGMSGETPPATPSAPVAGK